MESKKSEEVIVKFEEVTKIAMKKAKIMNGLRSDEIGLGIL